MWQKLKKNLFYRSTFHSGQTRTRQAPSSQYGVPISSQVKNSGHYLDNTFYYLCCRTPQLLIREERLSFRSYRQSLASGMKKCQRRKYFAFDKYITNILVTNFFGMDSTELIIHVFSGMEGSLSAGSAGSQGHTIGVDRALKPGGNANVPNVVNESTEVKPRSLRFTWSMKTTSSRDPNEIMAEIKKVQISRSLSNRFQL